MTISETEVLQLAIEGYKSRIAELETRLGVLQGGTQTGDDIELPQRRTSMSKAARKKISEAQKARHAAEKAAKQAPGKGPVTKVLEAIAPKPKRKMSPARKKALLANLAKARAARAAKRTAGGKVPF
jgi:hypothetical protein